MNSSTFFTSLPFILSNASDALSLCNNTKSLFDIFSSKTPEEPEQSCPKVGSQESRSFIEMTNLDKIEFSKENIALFVVTAIAITAVVLAVLFCVAKFVVPIVATITPLIGLFLNAMSNKSAQAPIAPFPEVEPTDPPQAFEKIREEVQANSPSSKVTEKPSIESQVTALNPKAMLAKFEENQPQTKASTESLNGSQSSKEPAITNSTSAASPSIQASIATLNLETILAEDNYPKFNDLVDEWNAQHPGLDWDDEFAELHATAEGEKWIEEFTNSPSQNPQPTQPLNEGAKLVEEFKAESQTQTTQPQIENLSRFEIRMKSIAGHILKDHPHFQARI